MARRSLWALALAALVPFAVHAAPQDIKLPPGMTRVTSIEGVNEYALPNGLHILTLVDDSKPSTTVNMTIKVGSRYEGYGETGMAHLLEHLMFKGSPKHTVVWAEFNKRGLRANGTTSWDRTNYFASMAQNDANLDWYIHWLGDALVNSYIARKDLDSEMTVVRNEMEKDENDSSGILLERVMSEAYEWHAYGKQTIGARSDVENVSIPHLQAFYHKWYQPDNAVLIITGKFDETKTLALVQSAFGAIPKPTRALDKTYTLDPSQDGEREVTLRRTGDTPILLTAYHIVPGSSPQFAAAELGTLILGGEDMRLHKALVEKGLAASADAGTESLQEPGVTLFEVDLKSDQATEPARQALIETVEGVAKTPFTQAELDRAKNMWKTAFEATFNDPEQVGVALSSYIALGDWRLAFYRRDSINSASLADVNQFATSYLLRSNRTLGTFVPTVNPVRAPAPARVDVAAELKDFKGTQAVASGEAFDASAKNIADRTVSGKLTNGIRYSLLTKQTRGGHVVANLTLQLGDEKSLFGHEIVGAVTASMLSRGTERLSREELHAAFDQLQATWSVAGDATAVSASVETTRANFGPAFALLIEVLRHPRLDAAELEQLRAGMVAGIESGKSEPETLISEALGRHDNPYPQGDLRYVMTSDEALAQVKAVSIDDVKAFYHGFYGATDAVFDAVGDFDDKDILASVTAGVGDWTSPKAFHRIPRPYVEKTAADLKIEVKDKQNAMLLAQLDFPLRAEDREYQSLLLGTFIFGSNGGRLWDRIREHGGLSYSVGASLSGGQFNANASWFAYAIFAPQNADKVRSAFTEELERARKDGFTALELKQAKESIQSQVQLGRAQDKNLVNTLLVLSERNLTPAYLATQDALRASITLDEVNAAFRKYVLAPKLVSGIAGDFDAPPPPAAPAPAGTPVK